MEIYDNNVAILKQYRDKLYEHIAEELEEYDYDDSVCGFDNARNGSVYMTYTRDGNIMRLNSNYNPDREAEKWAEQYEYRNYNTITVMYGFGTGVFVKALLNRIAENDFVIVCEPDIKVFVNILRSIDITEFLMNSNLIILTGRDLNKVLYNHLVVALNWSNIDYLVETEHPGYKEFNKEAYNEFVGAIEDAKLAIEAIGVTTAEFGDDITYNIIHNLKFVVGSSYIEDFKNIFSDDTAAILVAAGPSLDKNISLLKEVKDKAVVICVDTALRRLKKEGIKADFTVTFDPRKPDYYFDDTDYEDIPMFCGLECNPRIMGRHKAPKLFFNPGEYHESIMKYAGIPYELITSGGSVATAAVSICKQIGFKTLIIIGQDLAYSSEGLTHFGGFDDNREEKLELYVKGNYEEKVRTRSDWYIFLKWYERFVKYGFEYDVRVINATEGGAYIDGTEVMTFRKAIDECCTKDQGVSNLITEVLQRTDEEADRKIKEFLSDSLKDLNVMKKSFLKGITVCNRFERKYSKTRTIDAEVSNCMSEIGKITTRIGNMPIYDLVDNKIKHKDSEALKEIYINNEDSEYMNNINMIRNTKHIYELGLESLEEIYDDYSNAVKEVIDEK